MDIAEYVRKRDAILLALDIDGMIELMREHGSPVPSSREVAELTMHKARTAATSLPIEARRASKAWLILRGYSALDDGDV